MKDRDGQKKNGAEEVNVVMERGWVQFGGPEGHQAGTPKWERPLSKALQREGNEQDEEDNHLKGVCSP